jgi:type VI secretion system protein ImpA
MPTGLPLDFDALLTPIGAAEPAGSSSTYFELRARLDEMGKEILPEDFDANDPTRPAEAKRANWPGIEELTRSTLATTAKDLRIAGYLLEALVRRYGFLGLRDGLRLLRGMLEQCWERMYPSIEDGDLEVRGGVFNSLDDLNARGRSMPFPQLLRSLPLVGAGTGKHGFADWKTAQEAGQEALAGSVAQAIAATPPERGVELSATLDACIAEVEQLAATLTAKIGPDATHLPNVRAALEDCQRVVRQVEQKSADERPATATETNTQANGPSDMREAAIGQTRAEAYRQLAAAAALLQRLEPHSPIPYLVQRAVALGALPFPQLMKALIRDANVLTELNREMGIKSEETT